MSRAGRARARPTCKPHKIDGTMAFMVESCWVFSPTDYALKTSALDEDYDQVWQGFPKARLP